MNEFSNYGYKFKLNGEEVASGGHMPSLLKQLDGERNTPTKIVFKDLKGSAYIYRFGSASSASNASNTSTKQVNVPEPEPESESSSSECDDFPDLFG